MSEYEVKPCPVCGKPNSPKQWAARHPMAAWCLHGLLILTVGWPIPGLLCGVLYDWEGGRLLYLAWTIACIAIFYGGLSILMSHGYCPGHGEDG